MFPNTNDEDLEHVPVRFPCQFHKALIGTNKKPIAKKKPFRSTRLEIEFLEAREVPTTGLMAAFNFNAGTGSVLPDVSGNSNNGSLGGATWSTTAHTGDSHSLYFNGSSMVTVGNSASLDLTTGMTLEAWVDPTVVSTTWADVAYKGNNNYYLGASSTHSSDPTTQGMLGGTSEQIYGTSSLKANTWTFLSATYNGSVLDLYVNDVLVSSVSKTGNIMTSTSPLLIGGDTSGDFFTGFMDDLRVYNTALTAAQIKTDMSTPVVSATSQTITVTTPTAAISVGGTVALSATGGGSGNPVTYTIDSSSTGKGTISGSTLTATGPATSSSMTTRPATATTVRRPGQADFGGQGQQDQPDHQLHRPGLADYLRFRRDGWIQCDGQFRPREWFSPSTPAAPAPAPSAAAL